MNSRRCVYPPIVQCRSITGFNRAISVTLQGPTLFPAELASPLWVISGQTVPGQNPTLSAIVRKRTNAGAIGLSAKCQKRTFRHSFDYLVGARKKRWRHSEAERLSSLEVDHEFEFGRLHDWQIGRLLASENAAGVDASLTKRIGSVRAVAHEFALRYKLAPDVGRWHLMSSSQCNKLRAPIVEEWIGSNHEGVDMLLVNSCENGREVAFSAGLQDKKLAAKSARSGLQFRQLRLADRVIWICYYADGGGCGNQF